MRTCKTCLQEKDLSSFKKHTHGHRHVCKKCQYLAEMQNPVAWERKNSRAKAYRDSEKGKIVEQAYAQSEAGKQTRKLAIQKYEQGSGKSQKVARTIFRRLAKLQRTPAWLTETDHWMIGQAYELAALRSKMTGFAWHVDHVVPLQGKTVSGLHTPYNLQVIPAAVNISKSNTFLGA